MKPDKCPTILTDTEEDGSLSVYVLCSRESDISLHVDAILRPFHEAGWRVTEHALFYNFAGWQHCQRSGYRDDKNGYFLFTPKNYIFFRMIASKIEWYHETHRE